MAEPKSISVTIIHWIFPSLEHINTDDETKISCYACNRPVSEPSYTCSIHCDTSPHAYSCEKCDFHLHYSCAMLPATESLQGTYQTSMNLLYFSLLTVTILMRSTVRYAIEQEIHQKTWIYPTQTASL